MIYHTYMYIGIPHFPCDREAGNGADRPEQNHSLLLLYMSNKSFASSYNQNINLSNLHPYLSNRGAWYGSDRPGWLVSTLKHGTGRGWSTDCSGWGEGREGLLVRGNLTVLHASRKLGFVLIKKRSAGSVQCHCVERCMCACACACACVCVCVCVHMKFEVVLRKTSLCHT